MKLMTLEFSNDLNHIVKDFLADHFRLFILSFYMRRENYVPFLDEILALFCQHNKYILKFYFALNISDKTV